MFGGPIGFPTNAHSPLTPGPRGLRPEVFGVSSSSNATPRWSGCPSICPSLHLGLDQPHRSEDDEEQSLKGFGSFNSGSPPKTEAPSPVIRGARLIPTSYEPSTPCEGGHCIVLTTFVPSLCWCPASTDGSVLVTDSRSRLYSTIAPTVYN